jgi:F-type H+-transporting ATPase subunit a
LPLTFVPARLPALGGGVLLLAKFAMNRPALWCQKTLLAAPLLWLAAVGSARADYGGPVSPTPHELFSLGGFVITNSMVTAWFFVLVIIVLIRWMAGKPRLVPTRGQTIVEVMLGTIRGVIEPIVGERMVKPTFPLLASLFTYILIMNWSGLLPGVGTFGNLREGIVPAAEAQAYADKDYTVTPLPDGTVKVHKFDYFFRPGTADLNTTLALACVSMVCWAYYVLRYAGLKALLHDLFGNKAQKSEVPAPLFYFLSLIFFGVGFIEVISIIFRPVSLSFRLFGNVFGGENLISSMHGLVAFVLPALFYALEMLIGIIQAFVFTLLVAVYIGLICNHEGGDHAHDDAPRGESSPTPAH